LWVVTDRLQCYSFPAALGASSHTCSRGALRLKISFFFTKFAISIQKQQAGTGPGAGDGYEIFLQGFNWESHKGGGFWRHVKAQAEAWAEMGFTAVWLPPPSDSVSPQGYLPR
jgi:hypothetical protein